jgi:hypothetical protein
MCLFSRDGGTEQCCDYGQDAIGNLVKKMCERILQPLAWELFGAKIVGARMSGCYGSLDSIIAIMTSR